MMKRQGGFIIDPYRFGAAHTGTINLRFEQANGATTTVDDGTAASTWAFSAGAVISTTTPIAETASLSLPANTDYIETDWTTSTAPTTTEPFCIEFKYTPLASPDGRILCGVTGNDTLTFYVWIFYVTVGGQLTVFWRDAGGTDRNYSGVFPGGAGHAAWTWDGTTYRTFWEGVQRASFTSSSGLGFTSSRKLRIGKPQNTIGDNSVVSKWDNFRVTAGSAVYTSDFTPPTTI